MHNTCHDSQINRIVSTVIIIFGLLFALVAGYSIHELRTEHAKTRARLVTVERILLNAGMWPAGELLPEYLKEGE